MQGWIKLHRQLTEKAIWLESTPEQKTILITLLMMANHEQKEWEWKGEKFKAEPGQFVTSLESIVKKCGNGVSIQNVRTAIKRFEKYEFLTNQSTNKNRLISIVNWGLYQDKETTTNKQTNKQLTSNQQATNKQLTTNKNDKNDNKKDIYIIFDFWNSKDITKHRELNKKAESAINARLKTYSLDELKEAIDNYKTVYESDNHYFSHKYTLERFMDPNKIVPFISENEPLKAMLKTDFKKNVQAPNQPKRRELMSIDELRARGEI